MRPVMMGPCFVELTFPFCPGMLRCVRASDCACLICVQPSTCRMARRWLSNWYATNSFRMILVSTIHVLGNSSVLVVVNFTWSN